MTLQNVIKRLLLGAIPVAALVSAAGCTTSGEVYAQPAGYVEGPTYYTSPNVVYVDHGYGWDHNRHHYVYRTAPHYHDEHHVDVHAHF